MTQGLFIRVRQFTVLNGDFTVDKNKIARAVIPNISEQVHRVVDGAQKIARILTDRKQICGFVDFDGADIVSSENGGASRGRKLQDRVSARRTIAPCQSVHKICASHFIHQIGSVVACGAVDSQSDRDPAFQHIRQAHDTA